MYSQIITINKAAPNFLQATCPSCHPTNRKMNCDQNFKENFADISNKISENVLNNHS